MDAIKCVLMLVTVPFHGLFRDILLCKKILFALTFVHTAHLGVGAGEKRTKDTLIEGKGEHLQAIENFHSTF